MAYTDRQFEFEGLQVHYITGGSGFPVLLLHGSGPGVSTIGNWRRVLDPLAARFTVYGMDLIGFGRSARKPAPPYFDKALWLRQIAAMIRRIEGPALGLIGHSLAAALALETAAAEPRVGGVLTTGAMGAPVRLNEATARIWSFPRDRETLRTAAETLVYDRSLIDEAYLANREQVLFAGDYGDYFSAMFAGDKQAYLDAAIVPTATLRQVICPVAMLHGRDDTGFPASVTLALAQSLPQANILLIGRCSHSIAMEYPDLVVAAAETLFPRADQRKTGP
jgi:2-hydroxymuconate-semialdehyde hydrolase